MKTDYKNYLSKNPEFAKRIQIILLFMIIIYLIKLPIIIFILCLKQDKERNKSANKMSTNRGITPITPSTSTP